MPGTAGPAATVGPRRVGAHCLLMAATDHERRVGAAAWVDRQLSGGAKVYYKGWLGDGTPWLTGAHGARRAAGAVASGQLEMLDFATVIERCGATTEGLWHLQAEEVTRALEQGWARVAMSQESPGRPMADDAEAAELAAQEASYDDLARRWPLTTLCQLTLAEENKAAAWETAAVHHHQIIDPQWTCCASGGRWWLRGTLDAHVSAQFGAALYGALREARDRDGDHDLHVDLSGVEFVDLAFVQTLFLTAHSVARHQRLVLHGCTGFARRLLDGVGRPATVLLDDGRDR